MCAVWVSYGSWWRRCLRLMRQGTSNSFWVRNWANRNVVLVFGVCYFQFLLPFLFWIILTFCSVGHYSHSSYSLWVLNFPQDNALAHPLFNNAVSFKDKANRATKLSVLSFMDAFNICTATESTGDCIEDIYCQKFSFVSFLIFLSYVICVAPAFWKSFSLTQNTKYA